MSQTRQLAAIMFTDIVGYTALMGDDEVEAFELLKQNRELQKPLIEKFNGKWIKEIGDAVLASFSTVTDAVLCASEIQYLSRQFPNLKLRIGIHQGEVVFENREIPVNNPAYGWNGNYKGKAAQPDVYIYQLEIICANGEVIKYSGNIALIR